MTWNLMDRINSMTSLAQRCLGIVRLREFDTSTPEGRSLERYRRLALTAITYAGARGASMASMLIAVPLTLHYLGSERYGLWMTISAIVAMVGYADLGMGSGLMNAISEAYGQEDRVAAERYTSSGFFMLSAFALLILIVFAAIYPVIPWPRVFNVKSPQAIQEAGPALAVFIACFAVNLPLGVVQRVQVGYQESYINSLWESAGKMLGLAGLLLVIYLKGGLVWLVLAMVGTPILAWLLNGFALFGWRRPWLRPQFRKFHRASATRVLHTGVFFFVQQIGLAFIFASDNLIIAQFLGPEAVTQYAIPFQLFGLSLVIFNLFISPLWPAYGEAIARGDLAWVRKTLNRSLKLILLSTGLVSLVLIIFAHKLIHLWVGPQISPSLPLNLGLGLWMMVFTFGSAMSMLLNAANIFRFQVIFISLTIIFSLLFKCCFIYYLKLSGIVWGTIFAFVIFYIIPYSFYINKMYYKDSHSLQMSRLMTDKLR